MLTRAIARYIRVSPRKTRKVIGLVRGLNVVKAQAILDTIDKRPKIYIKRLLHSAVDSADKRFSIAPSDLYISSIKVDQGPMVKRFRAASMGRATMIKHRTSHIILELEKIKRPETKLAAKETKGKRQATKVNKIGEKEKKRMHRKMKSK